MLSGRLERPPVWALVVAVVALVVLGALLPAALGKGRIDGTAETPQPGAAAVPTGGPPPVAVFLGDEWTEGQGADSPTTAFAEQVARAHGWRLINAGQGGTGYVTDGPAASPGRSPLPERVADVVAQHPDVVIVAAGLDDAGQGYRGEQVTAAVRSTLEGLRQQLPDAFLAVIGPFWPNQEPIPSALEVDRAVSSVATELRLPFVSPISDKWITGTNDGTPLGNRARYIRTGDGGPTPTQEGHDYLATKINEWLDTLPDLPRGS